MQHSGIGGGGFMLVRSSSGEFESIGESLSAITIVRS
jgi:gamma-glutamyltranspeptidase